MLFQVLGPSSLLLLTIYKRVIWSNQVPRVRQRPVYKHLDVLSLCQDELDDNEDSEERRYVGVDLNIGDTCDPTIEGIWDSYRVIRNAINGATGIASNLLLCDELLRAGRSTLKEGNTQ